MGAVGLASSSSGDEEDHVLAHRVSSAKERELRELRDKVKKLENERKKPVVHFEEQEEDAKPGRGRYDGCG